MKELEKLTQFVKENGAIRFHIHSDPDGFWAESSNVDTIYSSGKTYDKLMENVKDATFTYFNIPKKYCHDNLLKIDSEVTIDEKQLAKPQFAYA